MKVKDIVKKVNPLRAAGSVYVRNVFDETRKLGLPEFSDYYYDEKECTVMSIDIVPDGIIINYK